MYRLPVAGTTWARRQRSRRIGSKLSFTAQELSSLEGWVLDEALKVKEPYFSAFFWIFSDHFGPQEDFEETSVAALVLQQGAEVEHEDSGSRGRGPSALGRWRSMRRTPPCG